MHTGGNGSTDQSVEDNAKGTEEQPSQKPDTEVDQDSQAAHSRRSGDAESAGRLCTLFGVHLAPELCNNLPAVTAANVPDDLVLLTPMHSISHLACTVFAA